MKKRLFAYFSAAALAFTIGGSAFAQTLDDAPPPEGTVTAGPDYCASAIAVCMLYDEPGDLEPAIMEIGLESN